MINTNHTFVICAYKESPYLEECIKSLINQSVKTNIHIATSTPCEYIDELANKYGLKVYVNEGESGITQDWNFAMSTCETDYITLAHQDDVYDKDYLKNMLSYTSKCKRPLIFFTDYGELRNGKKVLNNKLLRVKRVLLFPLRFKWTWNKKWVRRRALSLGSAICCPSVTMNKPNLPTVVFKNNFRSNEDWEAWENLTKLDGEFVFCNKILMYHRIHVDSETSKIIKENKRGEEDFAMYCKFWPKWIAKILTKTYASAEKSNNISD